MPANRTVEVLAMTELELRVEEVLRDLVLEIPRPGALGDDGSLASGEAGLAVLFAHMYRHERVGRWRDRAIEHLRCAQRVLAERPLGPGLFCGFLGIGWTHTHVGQVLEEWGEAEALAEMDDLMAALLARNRPLSLDLISGLAGFGVYGLQRLLVTGRRSPLAATLSALEQAASHCAEGTTWFTPPLQLPSQQRKAAPQGYYNLGMAHGAPAAIAILGQALATGGGTMAVSHLYRESVRWLLAQANPAGSPSRFDHWVARGKARKPGAAGQVGWTRIAWCYGDLGLGVGLLLAAKGAGDPVTENLALEICRQAAHRPLAECGLMDAGLCHGAAGTAHLFHRLARATGEQSFRQAAEAHLQWLLAFRQQGLGIAGFRTWQPGAGRAPGTWQDTPGMLEGAAGIGLALLAFLPRTDPSWDAVLLANLPAGAVA
jgi:hypothetical protein